MARDKDDQGRPLFARSPRQASRIFGLDQPNWDGSPNGQTASVPRPKFLFLVRFVRGVGQGSAVWADGLTFAVKRVERPKVHPQTQVVNQYNKKRLIQTGIKYDPVTVEFYDTTDSVVSAMWNEYSAYYFGDQRRREDNDWSYDVTLDEWYNTGDQGFGLTLPAGYEQMDESMALESGYFFERVECYQFYGKTYQRFDLIHPKISSFNPDDMDYESGSNAHGISMALEYETIIYQNPNQGLNPNSEIGQLVAKYMDGDVYNPPSQTIETPLSQNIPFFGNASRLLTKIPASYLNTVAKINSITGKAEEASNIPKAIGGALGSFGSFDFGGSGIGADSPLANIMKNVGVGTSLTNTAMSVRPNIPADAYDVALGKAQKAGSGTASNMAANLFGDVLGAHNSTSSTSQIGIRTASNNSGGDDDINGLF